ncbi:hypothetical protein COF68_06000 [Bacillus toyonensis]|uniref:hypothetical protein n=1 Tax=Bacillus toyonensis TaxID=155322 RepID=UPI000BFE5F60|nr:hypothetical protein [Bacillus toyonensis]PHE64388.1 hypothetical protein COF68_06000 [Bacillus toyonensis]
MGANENLQVTEETRVNVLRLSINAIHQIEWCTLSVKVNEEGIIEHETILKAINGGDFTGGIYALEESSMYYDEERINTADTMFTIKTPYEYPTTVYGAGLFVGHGEGEMPVGLTDEEIKDIQNRCKLLVYGKNVNKIK